jgi:hypothetical protein
MSISRYTKFASVAALTGILVATGGQAAMAAPTAAESTRVATVTSVAPSAASADVASDRIWTGKKKKAVILALRHGGPVLATLIERAGGSPEVANYIRVYGPRLADFLENTNAWAKTQISNFLFGQGVPRWAADLIAEAIVDYVF